MLRLLRRRRRRYFAAAEPPRTTVHVDVDAAPMDVDELARAVRVAMLRQARRNGTVGLA